MNVKLNWRHIAAVAMLAIAWWNPQIGGGVNPLPDVPVIATPAADLKEAVLPITTVLAGHPTQAKELAGFYRTAAEMIRRDGTGDKVLANTRILRTFLERSVTLRFQGDFLTIPGLGPAIHGQNGAVAKMLGLDPVELNHAKAAVAIEAVAWACQEAGK